MDVPTPGFEFELPILDRHSRLRQLEQTVNKSPEMEDQIRRLRREIADVTRDIYSHLSPWQTVQVARHKDRPHTIDYLKLTCDEFVELHGYKERTECFFGCAHPEGYRKAMAKMRMAAKFGLPVICFIDTPGAYPGIGAEERGQAQVIAENMFEMSRLPTPIVCVVIGEGGSGGALGIGVGDRVGILEHAYYSVISPEGCAGILWKSNECAPHAAQALRFTSKDLIRLGIVDEVIAEPLGGAHRDHHQTANRVKMFLLRTLRELTITPTKKLLENRYAKFRRMGVFLEAAEGAVAESLRDS
jgi:acetyl-CoA carboxylase carboxyl transferase subunit alpha